MSISKLMLLVLMFTVVTFIHPSGSFAQATRTWVSGVGDDANPCSRTAPCKTFAGAISKTATGGEINVIEPGAFGALTITKAISIVADGLTAGVLTSGTNGIIVNTPASAKVILQGLDIEGLNGTGSPGLNGVHVIGQGRVTIRKCSIRNFGQSGVNVQGTGNVRVFIEDSAILGNGTGLSVSGIGSAVLLDTTLDLNSNFAVRLDGTGSIIMHKAVLLGSPVGISISGGGAVISYGGNVIRNGGAPTEIAPLQ